jgi:phosphoenolpyruvate carboxylase
MGSLLGGVIRQHEKNHATEVFEHVESMRQLAKQWRDAGANRRRTGDSEGERTAASEPFEELCQYASRLTDAELFKVSRAFTHFLALANAAEAHHRARLVDQSDRDAATHSGALHSKPDSCGGLFPSLLAQGHSPSEIYNALVSQTTELVLTAHPTEVNRRTLLDKKRRIQDILTKADQARQLGATVFEQDELDDALHREISSIWQSDEVSREKPTPQTEAQKGTLVVETVLWETVPRFLRKLDATMREFLGEDKGLPLEAAPIRFASWMGGDRDGNPNVKPGTTREVCLANRAKAAALFASDLSDLWRQLSITTCSDELRHALDDPGAREPYRAFLKPRIDKLHRTKAWAEQQMLRLQEEQGSVSVESPPSSSPESSVYLSKKELQDDLLLVHRSLCDTNNELTARGLLTDILRNVSAFGLTLVPLDVRQEFDRHEEAMDAVTRFLGLGSYSQWDEQTRLNWLGTQISSKRPLLRAGVWHEHPDVFSPTVIDTLEIFQMIADQHPDSLGAYVISQATTASDVLAVLLLQLDAGVKKPLRVVPLFETLDDLNGAPSTMKTLFSLPPYMGIINGKQEVMIGYSDSAKDAGRLAASWAQFETQEVLADLARRHGVDLSFFHGKGGTVGRGGNPQTFLAITSHPPKTINGKFRVTEQGEMITQNFGYPDRAERTLDIYTAAVLAEKLLDRPSPPAQYRNMMKKLSDISCDAYRRVVRRDARFVPYFRSATPELELASLNIGSRPAKRKAGGGVESLRAIPWNFAWTQTRCNLPTWLGVGEAFDQVLGSDEAPLLRDMYENFDSFRTMVDLVEMVLSKSEPAIARHYEDMLVTAPEAKDLGMEVRKLLEQTEGAILDLTGHDRLGGNNAILMRALAVRNPYVDCLNILQAETLKRYRQHEDGGQGKDLKDALMTTITGISNGMGNTG